MQSTYERVGQKEHVNVGYTDIANNYFMGADPYSYGYEGFIRVPIKLVFPRAIYRIYTNLYPERGKYVRITWLYELTVYPVP